MKENKKASSVKKYRCITERFCSHLGDNAIIVTTVTERGEEKRCLCSDCCDAECEHNKNEA